MSIRGKVLQGGAGGQGVVTVNGQQYSFSTAAWRSDVSPAAGMSADVEFGADGNISQLTQVPEQQVTKEQAEAVMNAARQKGGAVVSAAVAKFGVPLLVSTGLLLIAWFFLSAVSVTTPFAKISFTFWQVLGFVNASNAWEAVMSGGGSAPSTGIYGLIAFVALAGPYVRFFWKDKRAALGGFLPLVFLLFVGIMVRSTISSATGGTASGPFGDLERQAQQEMMNAISVGMGAYLSLLVSAYLGWVSLKLFLAGRAKVAATHPATTTNS
ncbi:MAG TPA: hypothetical protein VGG72_21670 [Bryobacteraceae bacterium]|jgi:hypothetical protein